MTTYFYLKNLTSSEVHTMEAPDRISLLKEIPSTITTKQDRTAWAKRSDTNHAFINLFEGVNAGMRINPREGNPVYRMHGLVVDYDTFAPENATILQVIEKHFGHAPDLMPSWIVATRSGGRRLIWEFPTPIGMDAGRFCDEFLKSLRKELRLPALLAGLDEGALMNPATYYEIGAAWERINPRPIPEDFLQGIFWGSVLPTSKRLSASGSLPEIPIPHLYKEIETRWPGSLARPESEFFEGCRTSKFWLGGGNPTACIIQKHGVYCFSTTQIFHSWAEILGEHFVRAYERDRVSTAVKDIYYFGKGRFCRIGGTEDYPAFIEHTKDEVKDYLKVSCSLNPKRSNETGGSEIDRAIQIIHETHLVGGRAPFLWNPNRVVECMGHRYLNDGITRPMIPAADTGQPPTWGEGFPWTAKWLDSLFDPPNQLFRFLAWMRRAYSGAINHSPGRNLALFLVGTTNLGKTLWNQVWWPFIMGGGAEATNYLLKETNFLKFLAYVPHWFVDDAKASVNERESQIFTESVKAFVANPTIEYQPKFTDAVPIEYHGTLCITMNEDDQSLRMLPSLDRSVIDKVLVLKCAKGTEPNVFQEYAAEHGEGAMFDKELKSEVPAFLRWLLHWQPSEELRSGRFGVQPWVHPDLQNASVVNSAAGDLLSVIDLLMETDAFVAEEVKTKGCYDCTAIQLLNVILANPSTNRLLGGFGNSARGVGVQLSKLAKLHKTRVVNLRELGQAGRHKGAATTYRLFPAPAEG